MNEVAGEVADGVITHGICTSRYLQEVIRRRWTVGWRRRGGAADGFEVTCPGFISVVEDPAKLEKARNAMRNQVGYYASTPAYRPVLELHGWGDLQTELYACSKKGRWDEMARLIDDEVLDTLTSCAPRMPWPARWPPATAGWSTGSTSRGGARTGGPTWSGSSGICDRRRPPGEGFVAPGSNGWPRHSGRVRR